MKIIIIGNGIAGIMAAAALREQESDPSQLSITIYTREPYPYYSRFRLPEIFGLNKVIRDLQIYKEDWYEKISIRVRYGFTVEKIDPKNRKVVFQNQEEDSYDKLLLASGADSFVPSIPHITLPGIFKIREYADAFELQKHIEKGAKKAVVLGGGLLGLEAARYMEKVEKISIVEIFSRLLPKQLDEDGASILKEIIENMGMEVILNDQAVDFTGQGKLEGILLKSGNLIDADTAVISMGITPRIRLAKDAGLETRKGVIVNQYLQTSDPDIYAAGDIAEYQGVVWGIIPAAVEQAPIAAWNMFHGNGKIYNQTIPKTTLKVVGVHLTSIGKVILSPEEEKNLKVVKNIDRTSRTYEKMIYQDGILKGAIVLGDKTRAKWAEQNMGKPVE